MMTTINEKDPTTIRVTESVAKLLRDKDRIICTQAKRIDILERELLKFRKERDSLCNQVIDLTDKLSIDLKVEDMLVLLNINDILTIELQEVRVYIKKLKRV